MFIRSREPAIDKRQLGVTLIELIIFLVVISIAFAALIQAFSSSVIKSVDPIVKVRLLELAQSKLDEVVARKYDHATPSGGVPACNSGGTAPVCTGVLSREGAESCAITSSLNDVDDFNGCSDTPYSGYTRSVDVFYAGSDLGLATNSNAKRIQVQASHTSGASVTLSSYRANF